jgi:hypothetical protein
MVLVIVATAGFLIMLWLVLSTVGRLRPDTFKLKATATKWLSLDLEMQAGHKQGTLHQDPTRDAEKRPELGRRSDDISTE